MSKNRKIIIMSIMLAVFILIIGVIAFIKTRPVEEMPEQEHNYAINEVVEEDEVEPEDDFIDNKIMSINDVEFEHLERLTNEQSADKATMIKKLGNRTKYDVEEHGKVVSTSISESSDEGHVYIEVTFEDEVKMNYICTYDSKNMHSFLRCVSLEEWQSILNGDNAG